MVNFLGVMKGGFYWMIGIIITIMLVTHVVPHIETAGDNMADLPTSEKTEIEGIVWLMIILIMIGFCLVLPNAKIIPALQETNPTDNKIAMMFVSAIFFILTIVLTIRGWFALEAIYTAIQTDFVRALYFLGLLEVWVLIVIVAPLYAINQAKTT